VQRIGVDRIAVCGEKISVWREPQREGPAQMLIREDDLPAPAGTGFWPA